MKLYSLETFIVKNPPPAFGGRYFIFVRLETACGIVGTGEIYAGSFAPDIICRMAQDVFARYLADHSPFNIETFWRRAHGSGFSHRPDPSMQAVVSGLEMACWDIIGKALDRPVYDLLGGQVHRRLRTYSYIYPENGQDAARFYQDPDASAATAARYVKAGFTAVKCDPVGAYTVFDGRQPDPETLQRAAIFCRQIRAAVTDRPIFYLAPMASSPQSAPSAWPIRLRRLTRYGWKSQPRQTCLKKWPRWPMPHQCRLPPVKDYAANMSLPVFWRLVPRRSYSLILGVPAAFWRPRKSPPSQKPITHKSRHISIAGPSWPQPISSWRHRSRISLFWKRLAKWTGFTPLCWSNRYAGKTAI